MTRHPAIWFGGVLGSGLAHLGFAAALIWSLQPDQVEQQPSPQSELQLQAYRVPRTEAEPQAPQSDPAAQSQARGEGIAAGAVPQSTAQSLTPKASPLAQTSPDSTALTAKQQPSPQAMPLETVAKSMAPRPVLSAPVTAAVAPVAAAKIAALPDLQTTAASSPAPASLPAASVQPSTTATLVPAAQPIVAAPTSSTPTPQQPPQPSDLTEALATPNKAAQLVADPRPVALAQPESPSSPEQAPATTAVAEQPPAPVKAALSDPDVPYIKAALAFSGADAGQADPVSLAAFQSFMRPGDIATTGDTLRDGVGGILAAVPCSRLQVMFDPETATLNLRGHLPEAGLRAPVLAALQAQMGADIQVSDQMKLLPRPQCGALAGISNVGLPQSTDQITNPLLIGADTHVRVLDYTGGERMFFDLTAPDYDAYIYVDYFDAGGAAVHLSPNQAVPLVLTPAQSRMRVGAKAAGDTGLQITVGPPYGQEIAVAFAASHPLYHGLRPLSEDAAEYLSWLTDRVTEARATYPDFKGEWVYFFMSTTEQ
ncbi:DUF4384 domain-containing protein (plasmid) [Parasedimentitalea marina]|uniref:DUF4384 domain-containing protein n=1 Tax=Parasedimentitalea marina TaxID=2483033 RepID=A0A3T0NAJ5_9RHOB|nr:DUF4384 domain-containing protein [Parasedimentitalea marina]AZV81060.1 DUF4384 domain-containing protein [Parasedimentitalea marina]